MKCPIDETELSMTDRQGIEIDYCPQCRGVWLDRGELDKIIERTGTVAPIAPPSHLDNIQVENQQQPQYQEPQQYRHQSRNEHYEGGEYGNKKRKKEGFLGDLFDF